MSDIVLIKGSITLAEIKELAKQRHGDMIKAVIDIETGLIALGGEMHSDEEEFLLGQGSEQKNLWGINIFVDLAQEDWIEFDSMINIRPAQNNKSRSVEDKAIQAKIIEIINKVIK